MKPSSLSALIRLYIPVFVICGALTSAASAQQVTFFPYVQLGDNGPLGPRDQIVIAWQTNEMSPNVSAYKVEFQKGGHHAHAVTPTARVVDNYLAADLALPTIPGAYGPHSNYIAVLRDLSYDTVYQYRVTGPGMPAAGFASSFRTRKRGPVFSFAVEGDEGFYPVTPNANPPRIVNYEARIAHLIFNAAQIQLPNEAPRPEPDFILDTGDNVYNQGTEDNYRDFFFPVFNSDQDSNETGAPLLRSKLFFPVDGTMT